MLTPRHNIMCNPVTPDLGVKKLSEKFVGYYNPKPNIQVPRELLTRRLELQSSEGLGFRLGFRVLGLGYPVSTDWTKPKSFQCPWNDGRHIVRMPNAKKIARTALWSFIERGTKTSEETESASDKPYWPSNLRRAVTNPVLGFRFQMLKGLPSFTLNPKP